MRVFVTGASGHIGSAVVPELLRAGHEVVALARSETSAAAVKALGAEVRHGALDDLAGLREAAFDADAVVHLAFDHDRLHAGDLAGAAAADHTVVRAFGDALTGTGKAFVGIGIAHADTPENEAAVAANPRSAVARTIVDFAGQGIRSLLVAVPPVTHSPRDRTGFIPTLIRIARTSGVSAYVGEGTNRWPAAHTLDVGRLFRLALEKAPAGSQLYAVAEEGIEVREIAGAIGRHLGVPTASIPTEQAADHFKHFAPFMSLDVTASNTATRHLLDWNPTHPGLIADLDEGHYFTTS